MLESGSYKQIRVLTGENPHQSATLYEAAEVPACSIIKAQRVAGGELSFNDLVDSDAALALIREFPKEEGSVAVFFHHGNPCAVAVDNGAEAAYCRALENCDPTSIIEGILVINDVVDAPVARRIKELYLHVVIAENVTDEAKDILAEQSQLTIYKHPDMLAPAFPNQREYKAIVGGLLVQDSNERLIDHVEAISKVKPDKDCMTQLMLAWRVVKHTKTNAIVLVKDNSTVGIGPGLNNRVWSTEQAIARAGEKARGSVLASDAIIPLCESIEIAGKAGIVAIIEPGGWFKENENIAVANHYGIAMVTTGVNQFKH